MSYPHQVFHIVDNFVDRLPENWKSSIVGYSKMWKDVDNCG